MKPTWKQVYPWMAAAVSNLDSVDSLLRQVIGMISTAYHAEVLLWAGLATGMSDTLQVYATAGALQAFEDSIDFEPDSISLPLQDESPSPEQGIWQFYPRVLPSWLLEQQQGPQLTQLKTGDLIVPVTSRGKLDQASFMGIVPVPTPLQFVLQLRRPKGQPPLLEASIDAHQPLLQPLSASVATQATRAQDGTKIVGWSDEDLDAIDVICGQLGFAYSALYWRQRLEQSRLQAALVGRIARLLNSSLNPDEIVGRIVAELGQGLQCDRSLLVDLRYTPVNILSIWDHPDRNLTPLQDRQIDPALWRNVVDMFLQGGASYLELRTADDEVDPLFDWLHDIGALSVLMVPLFIQEEFFGAVALLSYGQARVYQLDELQTLRQVADQAAIALTNAQHYQSLWHKQEALRLQNKSLQREIVQDELTHLMNRRSLERELEQLSTRSAWATQSVFSVIVCDIDYFKLVNDTHGHLVGDEVLQVLAQRLQRQLRRETPVYRYGGEEFVVILMETELTKAVDVAERLRQAIRANPIQTSAGKLDITASFGVAQQNSLQDHQAWDVLHRADQALYEAKRQGRDRVKAI
ncbi:sensor domain-containing diguanylate cyclase [Oscillatoria sp. FACHB-1407]|uniref:sensor domain-containing diguanylate cyclase n=1 Tax=Oscillatoria sp. FACHB-1407 TaxID=2692847 RepID=UPI001686129C|nr:sensor domain-containing diguanylate cyclase [Oscillatoria sp. FACHB-1407]MBD2460034.1 sensor domain-containing diguanylate cyclase [Oscillatoria sp. FACHB-1407]